MQAVREPLQLVEIPDPPCGPDDAIVEVSACGVCRSDWHVWQGDWSWEGVQPSVPVVLGHEAGGTVVEVGPGVRSVRPGARVCVPFHESCGRCVFCLSGRTHLCPSAEYLGNSHDGAFAQLVRIPNADVNCIPLPDELDAVEAAAMGCRYMTAWRAAVHQGRARGGDWAVVYGCGGLGLSLVQILVALGAQVVAVDVEPGRLALAERLGAAHVLDSTAVEAPADAVVELTGGGAQLSFDALGASETFLASLDSLRRGGRHVQVGLTTGDDAGRAPVPLDRVTFRELEIVGSIGNPVHAYPELLALVAAGRLRPRELVTGEIDLAAVPHAIHRMTDYGLAGLVVATSF